MAAVVTNLAACVGGVTWCLVDYRLEKKWSTVGFCSGVIAGLVAITPGSGFVPVWAAMIYGLVAGIGCNFATQIKYWVGADDALDIFAVHGIGGLIGNILNAFFASKEIAHLDGYTVIAGGWVDRHWAQLGIQLADSAAGFAWSFTMTTLILVTMSFTARYVPALQLRATKEEEELGIDDVELGEFAYDYVELVREVKPSDFLSTLQGEEDDEASRRSHRQSQTPMRGSGKMMSSSSYPMQTLGREHEASPGSGWDVGQ